MAMRTRLGFRPPAFLSRDRRSVTTPEGLGMPLNPIDNSQQDGMALLDE